MSSIDFSFYWSNGTNELLTTVCSGNTVGETIWDSTINVASGSVTVANWDFSFLKYFPFKSESELKEALMKEEFIPVRIIFNDPVTICFFKDDSKVVVRCAKDEAFIPEVGVMACIMKKIFGSRQKFLKLVKSGYVQPKIEKA